MLRAASHDGTSAARGAAWARPALWLLAAAVAAVLSWPGGAAAADRISVAEATFAQAPDGDGIALYAQFDFELPHALEDAVNRGIALYFVVDFELYRGRWYWFDKKIVDRRLTYRLTYSPLTRQYRLARGTLAQPFDSLGEALATLRRVRGWKVIDKGVLRADEDVNDYRAQVRLRLDVSQLPKPFQINALTNSDWTLTSDWRALRPAAELVR
jgi:hypothetical protein